MDIGPNENSTDIRPWFARTREDSRRVIGKRCRSFGKPPRGEGRSAANDRKILNRLSGKLLAQQLLARRNPRLFAHVVEQEKVSLMLSRCANSECCKPFLRLRDGKLFLVETERLAKPGQSTAPPFVRARRQQRLVEHYWLCDECAERWTLIYQRETGIVLAPLARQASAVGFHGDAARGVA